ncbi:hypothetical protein [Flammeovirga kamogawensis]|uniref:Uncharacterized protein n=2 Tax=Flammeovirga kamogawensis TaxID=373891 RepID=A0ABX8H3K2_9BACT|nr:hypothetical protein [Flammeovirga kamogawensis]QWG10234.1 hypothetical protein KM029_21365 [Flammeovirga kamogawensis]TRX64685.1 hypothetical protein EO216_19290 [Flammeovirga kamogawensis]
MKEQEYINDLKEIKDIMNRSSRFLSLSGLSGISAGICALIGAYFAYDILFNIGYDRNFIGEKKINALVLIGVLTLVTAIVSALYFTLNEAKKNNQKLWDLQAKRLLINLFIPLATGGILTLSLVEKGFIGLAAPLTLIFYGLALVNASKYTNSELRGLGIFEIILGLLASQFIGYGLWFWIVGFGFLHIAYGCYMYFNTKK